MAYYVDVLQVCVLNGFCIFSIFPNHQVLTAQVSDTGRYVCVADNVAGSAEKSFNLNVHGESRVNLHLPCKSYYQFVMK